jgi:prepilin-type processing-associated H-X9-DG protein
MEQKQVFELYRMDRDWKHSSNREARETELSVMLCPSSPEYPRLDTNTFGGWGTVNAAVSDYGVNNAINSALYPMGLIDLESSNAPNGAMRGNEANAFAEVRDGLSNTMSICEDAGRPKRWNARRTPADGIVSGAGWANRDNEYITHGFNTDGTASPGPCPINCSNENEIYAFHPGGANTIFLDGSIHFLSEDTDIRVVGRLLTKAAGEAVVIP